MLLPAAAPLHSADLWLQREWDRRWPRRPEWLDRRVHGLGPPMREDLAAPTGGLKPGLVRPWRLRELVDEVLAPLPLCGCLRQRMVMGAAARADGAAGAAAPRQPLPGCRFESGKMPVCAAMLPPRSPAPG